MNCKECGEKSRTIDTRNFHDPNEDFDYVERKHLCEHCGHKFISIEVDVEEWNRRKIKDE